MAACLAIDALLVCAYGTVLPIEIGPQEIAELFEHPAVNRVGIINASAMSRLRHPREQVALAEIELRELIRQPRLGSIDLTKGQQLHELELD